MGWQAVVAVAFACTERPAIVALLGRPRLTARELGRTVLVVTGGVLFVKAYFAFVFGTFHVEELKSLESWRRVGWPLWGSVALSCLGAPLLEELAFRGFVQTRLARVMGARDALVVQAALFSVLHLLPWVFLSHFVLGLVLGEVRRATRSLPPSMLLHAAWNGAVIWGELR